MSPRELTIAERRTRRTSESESKVHSAIQEPCSKTSKNLESNHKILKEESDISCKLRSANNKDKNLDKDRMSNNKDRSFSDKGRDTDKEDAERHRKLEDVKRLGFKLRNLLKLPKAHRWVCYEWFYANIDRTLLAGENDFCACLKESFPNLKTYKMTRTEWCKIRRLMGKPRRCSQAFLAEERKLLNQKRQKIRQLQQQKVVDLNYYRDLPEQIPLSLVIGTRVTAFLHAPYDGLYDGTIDAVDTASHGYRITFDRESVGTHTVPDYEVLSNDPPEFLPLSSFQTRIKPRMPILKSPKFLELLGNQITEALGSKDITSNNLSLGPEAEEACGSQYPVKLLALMVRVSKILSQKKKRIQELKSMNDNVERLRSLDEDVPMNLKTTYASTILDLDKLNNDLDDHLKAVQIYSSEFSIDANCIPDPESIKQKCHSEASKMIESTLPDYSILNADSIMMITHMMSIMFHLRSLSENDDNALQLKALNDTMQEYKAKLEPDIVAGYEDNVEVPVNYIKRSSNQIQKPRSLV